MLHIDIQEDGQTVTFTLIFNDLCGQLKSPEKQFLDVLYL